MHKPAVVWECDSPTVMLSLCWSNIRFSVFPCSSSVCRGKISRPTLDRKAIVSNSPSELGYLWLSTSSRLLPIPWPSLTSPSPHGCRPIPKRFPCLSWWLAGSSRRSSWSPLPRAIPGSGHRNPVSFRTQTLWNPLSSPPSLPLRCFAAVLGGRWPAPPLHVASSEDLWQPQLGHFPCHLRSCCGCAFPGSRLPLSRAISSRLRVLYPLVLCTLLPSWSVWSRFQSESSLSSHLFARNAKPVSGSSICSLHCRLPILTWAASPEARRSSACTLFFVHGLRSSPAPRHRIWVILRNAPQPLLSVLLCTRFPVYREGSLSLV